MTTRIRKILDTGITSDSSETSAEHQEIVTTLVKIGFSGDMAFEKNTSTYAYKLNKVVLDLKIKDLENLIQITKVLPRISINISNGAAELSNNILAKKKTYMYSVQSKQDSEEQEILDTLKSISEEGIQEIIKDAQDEFKWDENESTSRNLRNLAEMLNNDINSYDEKNNLDEYLNAIKEKNKDKQYILISEYTADLFLTKNSLISHMEDIRKENIGIEDYHAQDQKIWDIKNITNFKEAMDYYKISQGDNYSQIHELDFEQRTVSSLLRKINTSALVKKTSALKYTLKDFMSVFLDAYKKDLYRTQDVVGKFNFVEDAILYTQGN